MPKFLKASLAVFLGFVAWFAIGTIGNLLLRAVLPGYEAVEKAMNFSLAMLLARLVLAAVSSIGRGLACGAAWRDGSAPGYVFALLLLALFVPAHVGLWSKFPLWSHATFLISLAPLALLGFKLAPSRANNAA